MDIEEPILGQAFQQGPVIIIWDAALHGGRHPGLGHNVIYHEFAHKLDMLDGATDGTPPLRDRAEYRDWILICSREYQRLRRHAALGKNSFLNAYGATNEAEFFAGQMLAHFHLQIEVAGFLVFGVFGVLGFWGFLRIWFPGSVCMIDSRIERFSRIEHAINDAQQFVYEEGLTWVAAKALECNPAL